MRLFIAINFNNDFKNIFIEDISLLKEYCLSANFTRRENLHLTLAFIGEVNNASPVKKAMDSVTFEPFEISLGGIGNFRDIYLRRLQNCDALNKLQKSVTENLENCGVDFDRKSFKPHITLARRVELLSAPSLPERDKKMTVDKISLMKSERINGRLVYTEIYSKKAQVKGQ